MRLPATSFALVALTSAQSLSITNPRATSTGAEIQPSVTETVSGPISTGKACSQISDLVSRSRLQYPSVEAELAYACLKSVPFSSSAGKTTIESLTRMVQFQSILTYLKNPPHNWYNDPVDLVGGLADINSKINSGSYDSEYDFEADISSLLTKAHDGHLSFDGMAFNGAFRWRRSRQVALISASQDEGIPKVWAVQDFNKTGPSYTPSAVSQIDGKGAEDFLREESLLNSYHDPDTRYNAMFYMQPAESFGFFTNPRFYPGPTLNISFENGTTHTYMNAAVVLDASAWEYITDGDSFYETYITPSSTGTTRTRKREPSRLPQQLQHPKDVSLNKRYVPAAYPVPFIEHSASDVGLAGYFIDHPTISGLGVLMVQTFNTETNSDAEEFQMVVQTFLAEAKKRGTKKVLIDVRTNGGGKIFLGYDMYKQFFPSEIPQLQSRYRAHDASDVIGSQLSEISFSTRTGELYTSPFNYHSYLDKDLNDFSSWDDMYGPTNFNTDNFTNLLRYNLSDPLTTSSDRYSIGVTVTGYDSRSNFTTDPFSNTDIVILSDGICASTCSLFTELMTQQSGVRTLAVGGRPSLGPMQAVGGTKGSLVLQATYLQSLSSYVLQSFATSSSEAHTWQSFLLGEFGISANDATVNFQDNIRKGQEAEGVPTQFRNDTASCRMWYTPSMYLNVTEVWSEVAQTVWGGSGGEMDEGRCVAGSATTSQEAVSSSSASGTARPSKSKGAAVGVRVGGQESLVPVVGCAVVVLGSMLFGASLI